MAGRRFKIKGTKDFLVLAVFCAFLCVWSIRDAWFPTKKILKKHPREIPAAFTVSGVVEKIAVAPGQEVGGKILLAKLFDEPYRARVMKADAALRAATAAGDSDLEQKAGEVAQARADVAACSLYNTDIKMTTSHGEDALRGKVLRIAAGPGTQVEAGEPVLLIEPADTFYLFNKSLAVLSFIGMCVALFFHRIASR